MWLLLRAAYGAVPACVAIRVRAGGCFGRFEDPHGYCWLKHGEYTHLWSLHTLLHLRRYRDRTPQGSPFTIPPVRPDMRAVFRALLSAANPRKVHLRPFSAYIMHHLHQQLTQP